MSGFEHALLLLLLVTLLSVVARWLPWPPPITYVLGGIGCAFLPGIPPVHLEPSFFFLCFLPPLLFSDGWLMPLREFSKVLRPVILLSIGLVVFTTLAVGFLTHALTGLPLPMGFALGAVISPTDAVATSAIMDRLKVPARVTAVLSGESLMNDATGLVAFKFALAAVATGLFSLRAAVLDFGVLALGGLAIGLAIGVAIGKLRDLLITTRNTDPLIEITISLLTPYAAYLAAETLHTSGILSVVAAGLYSGWRDPLRMDPATRQTAWSVWSTILFWLNGLAFLLLGLQFPDLWHAIAQDYSPAQIAGLVAALAGATMLLRLGWMFPGAYLPFLLSRRVRHRETRPPWQAVLVGGWAGMRGTVTLAAALSIPFHRPDGTDFPGRALVIFLAFGVVVTTLLLQGTTLGWLIRRLGLREDETRQQEERLARITAVRAGLEVLRAHQAESPDDQGAIGHVLAEYESRLAELTAEGETQTHARHRRAAEHRFRLAALKAERRAVDDLWRRNVIDDETHRPLQQLLDHEEAMLLGSRAGS